MAKRVAKGILKAKMLEYFREVESTNEELIVTSDGVPVLRVIPYRENEESVETLFADVRGRLRYEGDLTAPTADEWEAL